MHMSIEADNRAFLDQHAPGVTAALGEGGDREIALVESKKGGATLILDGEPVHSRYDPRKEAAKAAGDTHRACHIHIGLGLGYLLEADTCVEGGTIIVYEPDPTILAVAVRAVPLQRLFEARNAVLCADRAQLRPLLEKHLDPDQPTKRVALPYHARHHAGEVNGVTELIRRVSEEIAVTRRSVRAMSAPITTGGLHALPHVVRAADVGLLRDRFPRVPAVVVSAGPSLDRNIGELAGTAERMIVIAIGRTAKPLSRVGIAPHFLVHNEPNPFHGFIEGCDNLSETAFVLSGHAEAAYYTHPHGPTFSFGNPADFVDRWLEEHVAGSMCTALETAGSVANEAFDLAAMMGCDPIVLVGQDLAFSGARYYAQDDVNRAFRHGDGDVRAVPGYFGDRVNTLSTWLGYLTWFTERAARLADRTLINATEGGALIDGFQRMKLAEVVYRFCSEAQPALRTTVRAIAAEAAPRIEPAQLEALMQFARARIEATREIARRFIPFRDGLRALIAGFTPDRAEALQAQLEQLERFRQAYGAGQQGMLVLSGFMQGALLDIADRRKQRVHAPDADDLTRFLTETTWDLDDLEATLEATLEAADRFEAAVARSSGEPYSPSTIKHPSSGKG